MTTFSLDQKFVSKVTGVGYSDLPLMGIDLSPQPNAEQQAIFLEKLSRSDTAREMARRKWLENSSVPLKERVAKRGTALLEFMATPRAFVRSYAMFKGRRQSSERTLIDEFATRAWAVYITNISQEHVQKSTFNPSNISREFLRSVSKLSVRERGPKLALDAVREIGICVVLESGLPGMSVDGASFHIAGSAPVLALTLRHDRLDNFWFTLFHEIGHIYLHLNEPGDEIFVDSLDDFDKDELEVEAEANAFAKDSLIPRDIWLRSDAHRFGSEASVLDLAKHLGIHPAIVAGRIRYERREYRIFNDLIGRGLLRDVVFTA